MLLFVNGLRTFSIYERRNKMENMIFASTDEAIQHLANLMAVSVRIAEEPKEKKNIPPEEYINAKSARKAYERLKQINQNNEAVHEDVIELLEKTVAKEALPALDYALMILKGRFPKGESKILKDTQAAYQYVKFLMGKQDELSKGNSEEAKKMVTQTMLNAIAKKWPERAQKLADEFGLEYDAEKKTLTDPSRPAKVASVVPLTFDNTEAAIQYLADITECKVQVAM